MEIDEKLRIKYFAASLKQYMRLKENISAEKQKSMKFWWK